MDEAAKVLNHYENEYLFGASDNPFCEFLDNQQDNDFRE